MNALSKIRQSVKMNEASTKRGLVAVITGGATLYLIFTGQAVDVDTLTTVIASKVDFWMGLGLTAMGLLGVFLPDEPKTVKIELPPIELIGQSGMADRDPPVADRHIANQWVQQQPVQPRSNTVEAADHDGTDFPGWGS